MLSTVIQSIHQNEKVGRVAVEITSTLLFLLMYITVLFDSLHFTAFEPNNIKLNLTELATKTNCGHLFLAVVLLYLNMHHIPHALGCRACLWMWQEEGAFYVEHAPFRVLLPFTLSVWWVPVFKGAWVLMAGL